MHYAQEVETMAELTELNYARWLHSPKVSEEDKALIRKMKGKEKDDAFYCDIAFGTAGMRGILGPGTNRMNSFTVKKASVAFAKFILSRDEKNAEKGIVISHDNRYFSRQFTLEAARLFNEMGIKSYIFDALRPTPELSFAVRYLHAAGGVMITASHNPKEYNGYKVYDEEGCQLTPTKIAPLLEILLDLPDELSVEPEMAAVPGESVLLTEEVDDAYVRAVESIAIRKNLNKKGFKIVYTPQHGASLENARRVFHDLGYEFIPVTSQCTHDPDFGGTLSPNPENADAYIEPLKVAKANRAPFIVMTDPDGDRCGVAYLSSKGTYERFSGNQSAALLLDYILMSRKEMGTLPVDGVVYDTVVSSDLARKVAAGYDVKVESFLTGFKYIGDRIHHYEELGRGPTFLFGYEESYGCLISPFVRDKDGLQAILMYAEMALYYHLKGIPLDVAYENLEMRFGYHHTGAESIYFEGSSGKEDMERMMEKAHLSELRELAGLRAIRKDDYVSLVSTDLLTGEKKPLTLDRTSLVKYYLEDTSWIALRPSGTEPKSKFYVEAVGETPDGLEEKAKKIVLSFKKAIGVR